MGQKVRILHNRRGVFRGVRAEELQDSRIPKLAAVNGTTEYKEVQWRTRMERVLVVCEVGRIALAL
jgi:hypothetical protein